MYEFDDLNASDLRKKIRLQKGITMLEYKKYLDKYYNILINNTSIIIEEMKNIVKYLNGNSNGVCVRHLNLKNPHKSPVIHYTLLFKFLLSLPPYDNSSKYIAKILVKILKQTFKYNETKIIQTNLSPYVTLTKEGLIFYVN